MKICFAFAFDAASDAKFTNLTFKYLLHGTFVIVSISPC